MAAKGLLRHSSVLTTQMHYIHYIKEAPETTFNAMKKVEALCNECANAVHPEPSQQIEKNGAGGWTRTTDLGIMRPSLHP
jgi:hypothetical protein